jgi:hypothetical protein
VISIQGRRQVALVSVVTTIFALTSGCALSDGFPDDLCAAVGRQLIAQMAPDVPKKNVVSGPNSSGIRTCEAVDGRALPPNEGTFTAGLYSWSVAKKLTSLKRSPLRGFASETCKGWAEWDGSRVGKVEELDGLGHTACAVTDHNPRQRWVILQLAVQVNDDRDLLLIRYDAAPSTPQLAMAAARAAAGNVLADLAEQAGESDAEPLPVVDRLPEPPFLKAP